MVNEPLTKDEKIWTEPAPKLVPIWLEMVSLRNVLKDFPSIPAEQWYQFYYYGREEEKLHQKEELLSAVRLLREKIRELPNRDNELRFLLPKATKTISLGKLDGGGIGRFKVMKIIDEVFGGADVQGGCEKGKSLGLNVSTTDSRGTASPSHKPQLPKFTNIYQIGSLPTELQKTAENAEQ